MSWATYMVTFGATRPSTLPALEEPDILAKSVATALDWMSPQVDLTADTAHVRLTAPAPSAEAALHHLRGSFRSALHTAGVPHVGDWPLTALNVEPAPAA